MGRVRKKYPRKFKFEAVKQMDSDDHSAGALARRLSITQNDLIQWRAEVQQKQQDASLVTGGKWREMGTLPISSGITVQEQR